MRASDELIHSIVAGSQIPSAKRRREIERELRAHIEDFVSCARDAGHEEQEIETLLLARLGNPRQIAEGFSQVYRNERRKFLILAYALSTALLASSLLIGILAIQTGLAFGFGASILKMLASNHTLIQSLDILACVAVYLGLTSLEALFGRYCFQKTALLFVGVVAALALLCSAMGLHITFLLYGLITGVFFRAVRLFVPWEVARVGIVLVCFALTGFGFAQLRAPGSLSDLVATCASWLALGMGYLLMIHLAPRVDAAVHSGLQRF
jgi:hypothetical protein